MKTFPNTPLVLIILDGWGDRDEHQHNGIALARKPYYDRLLQEYPHTQIDASGTAVGLPHRIMGNSEVGHMNLGSGRIVYSGLSQIYQAIETGAFFKNPAYLKAMHQAKKHGSTLHLMGLVSDGAVHSHQDHLYALLKLAKDQGVERVAVHAFLDGRDTPPTSGVAYLKKLQGKIHEIGVGYLASISGRFYAMDRDQRWERVEQAFLALTGVGKRTSVDPIATVEASYAQGKGDEFVEPFSVIDAEHKITPVGKDDAMIFFNFRADRAIEISRAFTDANFSGFDRGQQALPAVYICTSAYHKDIAAPVAFAPTYPQKVLGEVLSQSGIAQLRLAETEKYAHVTYFFNGGRDAVFEGEDRALIPSPKEVPTYDLKPEMSAYKIRDEFLARLALNKYGVVIMNYANGDMVGHTAKPESIVRAVEVIDDCLSSMIPAVLKQGGCVVITADHGNCEEMIDAQGQPMTAHTTNLVPFIMVSDALKNVKLKSGGRLCDVAPTLLKLLNLPQPAEMTGESLIA